MKKNTTKEIIEKFRFVHGETYDYSMVNYKSYHEPVEIICKEHGSFFQRPSVHIKGARCPICSAKKRGIDNCLTMDEYIEKAIKVHGDKYDYSKVEYVNAKVKICIICPIHGEFWQAPFNHLRGDDCPKCAKNKHKRLLYNCAINDLDETIDNAKFYSHWKGILNRCFNENLHKKYTTYDDCEVCSEWLLLSNFKKWFDENYIEGYQLDKDILVKGNKLYSPQTCCFVPRNINTLLTKSNSSRGKCLIGVTFNKSKGKYEAHVNINGKTRHFGGFTNEYDAFIKYKNEKEKEIVRIANEYKDRINENVYNSLINYKVEITD